MKGGDGYVLLKKYLQAGQMARQVKVLTSESDNLR